MQRNKFILASLIKNNFFKFKFYLLFKNLYKFSENLQ